VIGGLLFATAATLIILPSVYTWLQARADTHAPTLDPDDPASPYYERRA
jgi:hypothetical protein